MGICYSKNSIEEITHSKYSLARQVPLGKKDCQISHVYIWKYNAEDLANNIVKFYDGERPFVAKKTLEQAKRLNFDNDEDKNINKSAEQIQDFLVGESVKWPFKTSSNEGYIILNIKKKENQWIQLQNEILSQCKGKSSPHSQPLQKLLQFRTKKVSLQMIQILYMIHLDAFKSYYFTQISQDDCRKIQYEASIEIIVGDLLQRIDCIKLVSISFQLEKYLRRGEQNILKKMYNEFQSISYINENSVISSLLIKKNNHQSTSKDNNSIINQQLESKLAFRKLDTLQHLQIQNLIIKDVNRIKNSQDYKNQDEKNRNINKLFLSLYQSFRKFQIINETLLRGINIDKDKILEPKQKKIEYPNALLTKQLLQSFKKNQENQSQQIFIVRQVKKYQHKQHVEQNKQKSNKLIKVKFEDQGFIDQDFSIIGKPSHVKQPQQQDLDKSSPFLCQITLINGAQQIDKKAGSIKHFGELRQQTDTIFIKNKKVILTKNGEMEDSFFLPKQLEQLKVDRSIYPIEISQTNNQKPLPQLSRKLYLSSYPGTSQYQQLSAKNISYLINFAPTQCYNYFIKDFRYDWYYLEQINRFCSNQQLLTRDIQQFSYDIQPLLNIECLIFNVISSIDYYNQHFRTDEPDSEMSVCLFCNSRNFAYSGTFVMAYLMFSNRVRISFEEAYKVVKTSTKGKFQLPKVQPFVYETQLINLKNRIQSSSSVDNFNSLNTKYACYKAYQVGLYSKRDQTMIVNRYIGEVSSSNQLQLVQNNQFRTYFVVPDSLTAIIVKTINILREDASFTESQNPIQRRNNVTKLIKNMGINLRIFYGKEVTSQQKIVYSQFIKQKLLLQLIKLQFINFPKKMFNVQKYTMKIDLIIQSLRQTIFAQSIQKSFRKPVSFKQIPLSIMNDVELLKIRPYISYLHRIQPFNNKQTLTFKYPILRPIFQSKKKDAYYFMLKKSFDSTEKKTNGIGCSVTFHKGENWIGLEEDKERFFENIVKEYLNDVSQERIWIEDDEEAMEKSLFDGESMMLNF